MGVPGDSDVLVVGAGPSGIFAATELARRRIPDTVLTLDDVGWASTFRMHRRLVPRLAGQETT